VNAHLLRHWVDGRVAVSAAVARHQSHHLGLRDVAVIPNAVIAEPARAGCAAFVRTQHWTPIAPDSCRGRFTPEKGFADLADAAAILHTRGTRFQLVLVGDGPLRADIEGRVREHGLADRVTIRRPLDHQTLSELITYADLVVVPSVHEGSA